MLALLLSLTPVAQAEGLDIDPYLLSQVWITAYDMDVSDQADPTGYGDPEDDIGFKVRRARAGLGITYDALDTSVIVGVSTGTDGVIGADTGVGLVEAVGGYTFGDPAGMNTRVSLGVQKVPFGREALMSSTDLAFQNRAVASQIIVPDREAGLAADFQVAGLRARAGVFNGNGNVFGDTDPGVLSALRAEYTLGEGDPYASYGAVDGFTFGVAGDFLYNAQAATSTMAYGGDLIVRVAGLTVMAEGHAASIRPTNTNVDAPEVLVNTLRWGGYVQAGYAVGIWEPALRFEMFDDDTNADDNGDLAIATVGVTAHLLDDHLQLGGGYVLRLELQGTTLPNDTARLWAQVAF